jgi:hypothetical protein
VCMSRSIGWSLISMFALSTTVNDPDVWLPVYNLSPINSLVFISFLIIILYFVHNLVMTHVYEIEIDTYSCMYSFIQSVGLSLNHAHIFEQTCMFIGDCDCLRCLLILISSGRQNKRRQEKTSTVKSI